MSTISASTTSTTAFKITTDTTGTLVFQTGASPTTAVTLNASQNMGLGVTPSAWNSDYRALDVSTYGNFYGRVATPNVGVVLNGYRDSGGSWLYKTTNTAARYEQDSGFHIWYNAPSGTAGNAITFTQAMTLNTSGNLGVGLTTISEKFDVYQAARISYAGGSEYRMRFTNTDGNGRILVDGNSAALIFGTSSAGAGNTATERARIDASGNVIIGGTTAYTKLQLNGGDGVAFTLYSTDNASGSYNSAFIAHRFNYTGTSQTDGARITFTRPSNADGNYGDEMYFSTRPNGGSLTEAVRVDQSQRMLQRAGRKSNAYVLGNQQMWVAATGSLANGSSFSLCTINQIYDNLCYELDIFVNRGGYFACKYAGVFGYNGFTKAISTGDVGAAAFTSTGTLYNETMTITNSSGVTVNQYIICLRIWGLNVTGSVSTGGADLVTSSYLTRIE